MADVPLLLCDLDDTLLDRQATFRTWAGQFAATLGNQDAQLVDWLIAEDRRGYRPRTELMTAIKARLGLPDTAEDLVDEFRNTFPEMFRCAQSVFDALRRARESGWRIAIVTNGSASQLRKVSASGLSEYVDAVCVSELVGCAKPDPRLLHIAARRCRTDLAGAWMVGDNATADIGAAHAACISSVWLLHGRRWNLSGYRPTAEAESVSSAIGIALGETALRP
jgi:putative hydrolase of the HAD superfamily